MADSLSQFSEEFDGEDDKEEYLALEIARTPVDGNYFRPSLADDQKIGFFSLDRNTQTDVTEIINIQELTQNIEELLQDAAKMRRDINFARNVMQADFDAKLHKKAIELYVRVNGKISEIERNHEDRVATVRRAFKQQLSDAIARMQTLYHQNLKDKMNREKTKLGSENQRWQKKFKEMQATIQRNESIIHMLKLQMAGMQEKEQESVASVAKTASVDYQGEIDHLRGELERAEDTVQQLEEVISRKEETNSELVSEVETLNEELEKARILIEQLLGEKEELQAKADQDRASGRKMMENQRLSMEKELEERIRQAKEEALQEARQHLDQMSSADRDRIKQLMDEKKSLEQALAQEKEKQLERKKEIKLAEMSQSTEQKLQAEISKLKKEIERVHKTWEKKFAILQQSLHALKDESYLRQTMQRQAAQLHQAAISFAYDRPVGIEPTGQSSRMNPQPPSNKKPLPDIRGRKEDMADYISYTVSAPSGRATTVFSLNDENQVMSDSEQNMPPDIIPLPSPPPDRSHHNGDRPPSARSHVVMMPAVKS